MKHLLKLFLLLTASILISNCSSNPSEITMKKANKYFKMADGARKDGKRRAFRVYSNKGLMALSKYLNTAPNDTAILNLFVKKDVDLGLEILKNYPNDKDPIIKIKSFYDELNMKVFKTKRDTIKVKNQKGKMDIKIKKIVIRPLSPSAYRDYSTYLVAVADTLRAYEGLKVGFPYLIWAKNVDSLSPVVKNKFASWEKDLAKYNLEMGSDYYDSIKDDKDPDGDDAIAAEYFTRVALKYDPKNKEALKRISVIRPKMTNIYSAYVRMPDITGMSVEEIDNDINADILIAITDARKTGKRFKMEISIYNDSYNPIEVRPDVFYVVDSEGKKYTAINDGKNKKQMPNKLVDTGWEERGQLIFKVPAKADIVKIVYSMQRPDKANGGIEKHYAEKYLK